MAVLINKAMIEILPKFAGRPPVSLAAKERKEHKDLDSDSLRSLRSFAANQKSWPGATGLAEDVRYYGAWMREEAQKRIGHLYPPVEITAEMANERRMECDPSRTRAITRRGRHTSRADARRIWRRGIP